MINDCLVAQPVQNSVNWTALHVRLNHLSYRNCSQPCQILFRFQVSIAKKTIDELLDRNQSYRTLRKNFGKVVKTAFLLSGGTFWLIFLENLWFRIFSGRLAENFNRVVKIAFYMSRRTFWRKILFLKNDCFKLVFRNWSEKSLDIEQEFFNRNVKIPFYAFRETFWRISFFQKHKFIFFSEFERRILVGFAEKICWQNCILRVPRNILGF